MEVDQQWRNIFDKDILKDSVHVIAMYITIYELLEDTLVTKPKDFYTVIEYDEHAKREYEEHVLSLYNKNACPGISTKNKDLIASLVWFRNNGAIDDNDIHVFADSRNLRNELTHQMLHAIAEGGEKIIKQLVLLYNLFCKIERWWILEIEIPISGEFDSEKEIQEDKVMSGNMVILSAILDILANDSNAQYKEICDAIGVEVK